MIGTTISHYRVIGRLGVGGMGVVYEAEDERLPRRVALKFLPDELADDADASRRLAREAATVALLNHPRICTIHEIDQHDGRPFIVMERLQGDNLKVHMARRKLETVEVLDIADQVADALDAAHTAGIVHRDIKPGNVFVSQEGLVKVLDFGLARRFEAGQAAQDLDGSTIPGRPVGTTNYMAPERILQLPLDSRCDLFSLGVVIYEMATGRLPFAAASPSETVRNILDREATPLTELAPDRPAQLDRIVRRLTAKRADDRYPTAAALRADLAALRKRGAGRVRGALSRMLGRLLP